MNEIQSSLFEAMKQFSDYASKNASSTLTIECEIIELVDEGQGLYKVGYLGNTFTVHSTNANVNYAEGDKVYILVPEGDFTKDKVIFGSVSPSAAQYVKNNDSSLYHDISDNLIDLDLGIIKMSSYEDTYSEEKEIVDGVNAKRLMSEILGKYLNDYRTISLGFSAQTSLVVDQQVAGNYGITLGIPLILNAAAGEGSIERTMKYYTLDVGNMLGNPYRLTHWAPQRIFISLDDQYTYDTDRVPTISYFCYGFSHDETKTDIKDIWLKDISVNIVNSIPEREQVGYNLTLKASEGEYFAENYHGKKTLTPTLKVNNKTTNIDKCPVYWFIEDASIKNDNKYYSPYGGFGWRCLNERTNVTKADDGTEVFTYITNIHTWDVLESEVEASTRYKCVVVYDENAVSAIISLKNLQSSKIVEIESTNGSSVFIKDTGYVDLTTTVYAAQDGVIYTASEDYQNSIVYSWMRYDKNGNFIQDDEDFFTVVNYNSIVNKEFYNLQRDCFETRIKFPVNEVEDYNLLYCSAYLVLEEDGAVKKTLIGTKSYVITTSSEFSYLLTVNNGNKIFKYDSDGDSPMGEAYDGPAESKITHVDALTYNLYKLDGEELTEDEYLYCKYTWFIPVNSMIEVEDKFLEQEEFINEDGEEDNKSIITEDGFYISTGYGRGNGLPYSIAKRFNTSKSNNTIVLRIEFNGNIIENTVPLSFIKEGDSGTNGTTFAAVLAAGKLPESAVTYGTRNAKGVAQKLKFIYNTTTKRWYWHDVNTNTRDDWNNRPRIFTRVYKNGELLKYGEDNDYTVNFSMFDAKTTNACFTIQNVDSNTGGMLLGINSEMEIRSNTAYVNIVQAEIRVHKGNNSITNAHQVIYAYYPIEITLCSFDTDVIPSLDGGFAHVLYASDGTNPGWDETEDFVCKDVDLVEKDLSQYFDIEWTAQNHLRPENAEGGDTFHTEPVNKYDDGNSKNYVMARLTFGEDKASELYNEIDALNDEIDSCNEAIAAERDNLKYLNSFAKAYTVSEWLEYIDSIQEFFDKRTNAAYRLNELLETSLVNLDNYLNLQENYNNKDIKEKCADLWKQLGDLKDKCVKALEQIQKLNNEEGFTFDDLISLKSDTIKWDDELKQHLTESFGIDVALTLQLSIEDVNNQISDYDSSLAKLMTLKDKVFENDESENPITYIEAYAAMRKEAVAACEVIPDTAFAKYVDMRDKVLCYLKDFDKITSITDIKDCFNKIYYNVLSAVFTLKDGKLEVKTSVKDASEARIKELNEQIAKANAEISGLNKILATQSKTIVHIKPIVFSFNTYEMSNINGWDGNKLEMGDGSYLLAPQVGAGVKDPVSNKFTGIVMGIKTIDTTSSVIKNSKQVGLFGYADGVRSLFLNADNGSAMFGRADKGGQIMVDPSSEKAYLYSSNFFKSYNQQSGLPTNYSKSNWSGQGLLVDLTTPQIIFGNGNFTVNEQGHLTAKGGGSIAGWKISDTRLTSADNKTILYSGGGDSDARLNINNTFVVYGDGRFKAANNKFSVDSEGNIRATGGTVGNWTITGSYLKGGNTTLNSNGTIECANLVANTAGNIGGWTIGSDFLEGGGIKIGVGHITGTGFDLSNLGLAFSAGTISLGNSGYGGQGITYNGSGMTVGGTINASAGIIGGWTITSKGLHGEGDVYLVPKGTSTIVSLHTVTLEATTLNGTKVDDFVTKTVLENYATKAELEKYVQKGTYTVTGSIKDSTGGGCTKDLKVVL